MPMMFSHVRAMRWFLAAWSLLLLLMSPGGAAVGAPQTVHDLGADHVSFVADQVVPEPGDTTIGAIANRAALSEFLRRYPQYEVTPFAGPAIEGVTFASSLAMAAGMAPAATYVNFRISSSYISRGFLEPMEILLARVLS